MEINEKVIEVLQLARSKELYAINQYLAHHEQLEFLGYSKLADEMKTISVEEMEHSGDLSSRIKSFNYDYSNKHQTITHHKTPLEIYKFDAALEQQAIKDYNNFLTICLQNQDAVSADLFKELIADEERHYKYFSTIVDLIETLGNDYLATKTNAFMSSLKRS